MAVSDVDDFMQELRREFLEDAADRMNHINGLLDDAEKKGVIEDESYTILKRDVHSLKGQAGVFDFPSITRLMHALEDHLEMASEISVAVVPDVRKFIDAASDVLESGRNLDEETLSKLCASLSTVAQPDIEGQEVRDIPVLLVMSRGTQRTLVGKELVSCGFRVITADDPFEAIRTAVGVTPRIAIINRELGGLSGLELINMFHVVRSLEHCRMILLTSDKDVDGMAAELADGTRIIRKGPTFFADLTEQLIDWGFFGEIGG